MKNKKIIPIFILFFSIALVSGCIEQIFSNNGVTYEENPTKISYTITYGYNIECSGNGDFNLMYDCDIPELINEQVTNIGVLSEEYENITLATFNDMKSWNISTKSCKNMQLGLTANVTAEVFYESDISGSSAWTIDQLITENNMVSRYCHKQGNETVVFINPEDKNILSIAQEIKEDSGTNNSFIIAKEIFKWLKEETTYTIHSNYNSVQTCISTFENKTGDCDDLSFLYISLCRAVKIPARFIRGFLIEENNGIPHAWAEVYVGEKSIGNNGWIPVECAGTSTGPNKLVAEVNQNFGMESAHHLRLFIDDGTNESIKVSLSGIKYVADSSLLIGDLDSFSTVTNYQELEQKSLNIKDDTRTYI